MAAGTNGLTAARNLLTPLLLVAVLLLLPPSPGVCQQQSQAKSAFWRIQPEGTAGEQPASAEDGMFPENFIRHQADQSKVFTTAKTEPNSDQQTNQQGEQWQQQGGRSKWNNKDEDEDEGDDHDETLTKKETLEEIKSGVMRDFVREHGERIRRSRKHADLFEGSGYLLDHLEELREFESRAEEHRRQRRSTDGQSKEEEIPNFASLSEMLTHLNGGEQSEISDGGLNLRFVNTEFDFELEEETGKDETGSKDSKKHRRRRRSSPLKSDIFKNDMEIDDEIESEMEDREKEAQESIARLDAMLLELAQHFDEEHLNEQADAEDERSRQRKWQEQKYKRRLDEPLAGYEHHLSEAYKSLVELRKVAASQQTVAGKTKAGESTDQDQQELWEADQRFGGLPMYLGYTADWELDANALRENVQQMRRIYRQIDEL